MPTPAEQDQQQPRPTSVDRAVLLLWGLVVVGAAVTVLVIVFRHELADAWSAGHPPDSAIKQPEFVPVVIVSYVVVAGLILTLVPSSVAVTTGPGTRSPPRWSSSPSRPSQVCAPIRRRCSWPVPSSRWPTTRCCSSSSFIATRRHTCAARSSAADA